MMAVCDEEMGYIKPSRVAFKIMATLKVVEKKQIIHEQDCFKVLQDLCKKAKADWSAQDSLI
jgi:hypothetical protein